MKLIGLLFVAVLALASPALAQAPAQPGGPMAIGQVAAQVDPQGHVAIIQAPLVAAPQASTGGVINLSVFGWLEPYVQALVQAIALTLLGLFFKSKYGQNLDQSSRDSITTFVTNRASSLIADGAVKIEGKAVQVDNPLLLKAANEAATSIPDAMKHFGLTPEVVAQKIIDAIPQTQSGAAMIATAHAADAAPPVPITDRPPAVPATPATTAPAAV